MKKYSLYILFLMGLGWGQWLVLAQILMRKSMIGW